MPGMVGSDGVVQDKTDVAAGFSFGGAKSGAKTGYSIAGPFGGLFGGLVGGLAGGAIGDPTGLNSRTQIDSAKLLGYSMNIPGAERELMGSGIGVDPGKTPGGYRSAWEAQIAAAGTGMPSYIGNTGVGAGVEARDYALENPVDISDESVGGFVSGKTVDMASSVVNRSQNNLGNFMASTRADMSDSPSARYAAKSAQEEDISVIKRLKERTENGLERDRWDAQQLF
jgi:hypothetical protein